MILKQSELISLFHTIKSNQKDSQQENDQSQQLEKITTLRLLIENVQIFFDSIDLPLNFFQFEALRDLTIYTVIAGDCQDILRLIQGLIGSNLRLNSLSLIFGKSKLNCQKFKYNNKSNCDINSLKLREETLEQLKALCQNFKFQYTDKHITFNYKQIWSNNVSIPKQLIDVRELSDQGFSEIYSKKFSLFSNFSYFKFVQFRKKKYIETNDFFIQKIVFSSSLQVLKLEFQDEVYNFDTEILQCQDFLKTILRLPKLRELDLKLRKDLSYLIINQFNQIESLIFEESQIEAINLNVNTIRGIQARNLIDLNFISRFKQLKKLSVESKYYPIHNLEHALTDLSGQLEYLFLYIKINQTSLKMIRNALSNCINLHYLNMQFLNQQTTEENIWTFPEDISRLKNLTVLNVIIKQNKFESKQLIQVGQHLKNMFQLTEFTFALFNNSIGDPEFIGFVSGLKELTSLKRLSLRFEQDNFFGDNSIICLAENLKNLSNLNHIILILHSQNISRDGTLKLQQSLRQLKQQPHIFLDIIDYETIILQSQQKTETSLPPLSKKRIFKLMSDDLLKITKIFQKEDCFLYNYYKYRISPEYHIKEKLILNIISHEISNIGYQGISNALSSLTNLKLLFLVFENCQKMRINGLFLTNLPELQFLYLHLDEMRLERQDVSQIYKALEGMKQLEFLELYLLDYQGMDLENNFFLNLAKLKKISIRMTQKCQIFYKSIDHSSTLKEIIFSHKNDFRLKEFEEFLTNLTLIQQMKRLLIKLNINSSQITQQQLGGLFKTLSNFNQMNYLLFFFNRYSFNETEQKNAQNNLFRMKRLVKVKYDYFK